jgi:hypothetical protein
MDKIIEFIKTLYMNFFPLFIVIIIIVSAFIGMSLGLFSKIKMSGCPVPFLIKYQNLFGEPGTDKGMRKYRFLGIAMFDTFVVLLCAFILSVIDGYPFWMNAIGLLLLGILVHRMFCVRTTVDKFLFP